MNDDQGARFQLERMKTFDLSTRLISEAVWTGLFEHSAPLHLSLAPQAFARLAQLDALRAESHFNTGSISTATQWALLALSYYYAPRVVAEIGTFIGKSTISIAMGVDAAGTVSEVHTCDLSNSMLLPLVTQSRIVQYPATGSTEMLRTLQEDGYQGRVQLLHVDGRLQDQDIELVATLAAPDVVIALDDFEGIEKGTANATALRSSGRFEKHVLITPPSEPLLRRFGFWDHSTTALMISRASLKLTAQ